MIYNIKKFDLPFVLFLFCCIFAPPFLPYINFFWLMAFLSIVLIVLKYQRGLKKILFKKHNTLFFITLLIFYIYLLLIIFFSLLKSESFIINNLTSIYRYIFLIPMQFICIIYILLYCKKKQYTFMDLCINLVSAGLIQVLLGFIALLSPSIKLFLINIISKNTGNTVFFQNDSYLYRYFGFADNLLDLFGYGVGILCVISLILTICVSIKYIIPTFLLLFLTFLNSRSGLIIFTIGGMCALVTLFFKVRLPEIKRWVVIFILGCIGICSGIYCLIRYAPQTFMWLLRGIENIISFIFGKESQYYEVSQVLFSDNFWTFPKGFSLLFGSGHNIYGDTMQELIGVNSDVGYVNTIWLVGILGFILLMVPFYLLFTRGVKMANNKYEQVLVWFIGMAFLVMMIKADIIGYNSGFFISLLILSFLCWREEKRSYG